MAMKILINKIQPAFNNAHRLLWTKYNPEGRILQRWEADMLQKEWWHKEHNVIIHNDTADPNKWRYLEFQNDSELSYFMLKYS